MTSYGKIVGRFVAAVADGPDADDTPDLVPLSGTVTFETDTSRVIDTGTPRVIVPTAIDSVLDASGNLCTPNSAGEPGSDGIWLVAPDASTNPTEFHYRVRYALTVGGKSIKLDSHLISVPPGETIDLALVTPPGTTRPVDVAVAEAAAAAAALSAAEAAQSAAEAGGADPQAIQDAVDSYLASNPPTSTGADGADGKSAYEVAVTDGFTGDETAWLASLVGPKGDPGRDGADGAKGDPGKDGSDGAPGAPGESAYDIAVADGFIGDETAWLASLVGPNGDDGTPGSDGTDGAPGAPGDKGDKGDPGTPGVPSASGSPVTVTGIWAGTTAQLPATRDANTIYFVTDN